MKDRTVVLDEGVTERRLADISILHRTERGGGEYPAITRPRASEKIIWDFLEYTDAGNPVWEALGPHDLTYGPIIESGPLSNIYAPQSNKINRYRACLRNCRQVLEQAFVVKCWIDTNPDTA